MQVTLKLYATLGTFLPMGAQKNKTVVTVEEGETVESLIDRYQVPRESCHLVMLNGVFQPRDRRGAAVLKAGDAVAVWPPVAGG